MLEFIKKAGVTFYLNVAAGLLALIGWILYLVTNGTTGYAILNGGIGIAFGVIAVLLIAGGAYTSIKFGSQHIITAVVKLAALVLLMVTLGVLIADRAGLAAAVLTYEASNNSLGKSVLMISIVCGVFILLAAVALVVCAFFNNKKAKAE